MKLVLLCIGCFLLGAALPLAFFTWACWQKVKGRSDCE